MIYNLQNYYPFIVHEMSYQQNKKYKYDYDNIILAQQKQREFKINYYKTKLETSRASMKKKIYKKIRKLTKKYKEVLTEFPEFFI